MKIQIPASLADLDPSVRFLRCEVGLRLNAFARSENSTSQDKAICEALALAKLISQIVLPLARRCDCVAVVNAYSELAESLYDLARPWGEKHASNFPAKPDHSLTMLDKLSQIQDALFALKEIQTRHEIKIRPTMTVGEMAGAA